MFEREVIDVRCSAMQGSLLTMGSAEVPTSVGRLERTWLSDGAWLDIARGWLPGSDAWFDQLRDTLPWQHARRTMFDKIVDVPRLIWAAPEAGEGVDGGEAAMIDDLRQLSDRFTAHYQRSMPRIHANLYRDGNDSVAWHRDRVSSPGDSLVAIISLGAARSFSLRPFGGGASQQFSLGWGDLLVMGGSIQRDWEHSVPKAVRSAPRISVMIRSTAR